MKIFLWTEDGRDKAGYNFWKILMQTLFPEVIVESKQNCSRLIKAVEKITDNENRYIIAYDHSFDNPQIMREILRLKNVCAEHTNIYELKMISFEFILLEFDKLIQWIYAEEDEFREKRKQLIIIRDKLISAVVNKEDYKAVSEIKMYVESLDTYNIEQLASKLLYELTRNTGFEVNKNLLGVCWRTPCCGYEGRKSDDLCGLDNLNLDLKHKMTEIFKYTILEKEFKRAGLEVSYD